jgi:hypothetical protein
MLRVGVVHCLGLRQRQYDHLNGLFHIVNSVPVAVAQKSPRGSDRFIDQPQMRGNEKLSRQSDEPLRGQGHNPRCSEAPISLPGRCVWSSGRSIELCFLGKCAKPAPGLTIRRRRGRRGQPGGPSRYLVRPYLSHGCRTARFRKGVTFRAPSTPGRRSRRVLRWQVGRFVRLSCRRRSQPRNIDSIGICSGIGSPASGRKDPSDAGARFGKAHRAGRHASHPTGRDPKARFQSDTS